VSLDVLTRAELAALRPPNFLLDGIVPEGSFSMLYGPPGSFKSFLALDWALSIASGREWVGRPVKPSPVLYVAGEGFGGLGRRVLAWETLRQAPPVEGLHVTNSTLSIGEPEHIASLVEAVERLGAGLVVLDTWARVTAGVEENSATEAGSAIEGLDVLRKATGTAVLVVHHSRKDGGSYRGSSALGGAVDAQFRLQRTPGGLAAELSCEKAKDWEEFPSMPLGLTVVRLDEEGTSSLSIEENGGGRSWALGLEVRRLIERRPGLTGREIADELHRRKADVLETLSTLIESGAIHCVTRGQRTEYESSF
jgi:hypothetical protein